MEPPSSGLTPADLGLVDFGDVPLTTQDSSVPLLLESIPASMSVTTAVTGGPSGLGRPITSVPGLEEFSQTVPGSSVDAGIGSVDGLAVRHSATNSKVGSHYFFTML